MFSLSGSDLEVKDKKYVIDKSGEIRLLTALFTDARIDGKRGYWFDELLSSELWQFEQATNTAKVLAERSLYTNDILKKLVQKGYYESAEAFVEDDDIVIRTKVKGDRVIYERKYTL